MKEIKECPITICMCSDDNGVDFMLVAIKSIFINNKEEDIELHLVTDGFSEKNIKSIKELADYYSRTITFHQIDASTYNNMPGCGEGFVVPKGTCFRFSIPDALHNKNKVLYLDTDVIVESSLRELWETNITGFSAAVVIDPGEHTKWGFHILGELGFNGDTYFNAGVILMNLDFWREKNVSQKCIKWLEDNPDKSKFVDQTALNFILGGTVKYIPPKYNLQFDYFVSYEGNYVGSEPKEIIEARKTPVIIHYTVLKPWYKIGIPGLPKNQNRFDYYCRQTPVTNIKKVKYKNYFRRKIYYLLYKLHLVNRTPSLIKNVVGLDRDLK